MNIQILYGIENNYTDVTARFLSYANNIKEKTGEIDIPIPKGDWARADVFGDPVQGKVKNVIIKYNNEIEIKADSNCEISVNIECLKFDKAELLNKKTWFDKNITDPSEKLRMIHKSLLFSFGDIKREYPEQLLSCEFIEPGFKVLEIGGNIGRNSLTIASLLNDFKNLVVLETNKNDCDKLIKNMTKNGYDFNVENSALSKRNLIQREWNTIPSDILLDGYFKVNIIEYGDLEKKYNIQFDTLVADCEGAMYYILMDMPYVLDNINLLIIENDYQNPLHRKEVEKIILKSGFKKIKQQAGGDGGPYFSDSFLEVWRK